MGYNIDAGGAVGSAIYGIVATPRVTLLST